jgi:SAM-dependent methyltransferase
MKRIVKYLREADVESVDIDGNERLSVHKKVLSRKPILSAVFKDFHQLFDSFDRQFFAGGGLRVELGSGVAPMRNSFPDVLATDIVPAEGLDKLLDAQAIDLEPDSVRVIFAQNCFHHLSKPEQFFQELNRVLSVGGGAILLEPYHGPLAAFLFKRLFNTEGYDKDYPTWETPATGPMNGANQALSYIVFVRDREHLSRQFPKLEIVHKCTCNNYLMYLLSGGLNFKQLIPNFAAPVFRLFQFLSTPLSRWIALHHIIIIRKIG